MTGAASGAASCKNGHNAAAVDCAAALGSLHYPGYCTVATQGTVVPGYTFMIAPLLR